MMKKFNPLLIILVCLIWHTAIFSTNVSVQGVPWNTKTLLNIYRPLQLMPGTKPVFVDLDNDNSTGNPFDFDMTITLRGGGFDYKDQVHPFKNLRGLPAADQHFMDHRIRQLNEFIYPDHEKALDFVFNRGKWKVAWLVCDEDDYCERWERVELLDPKEPYTIGARKGGLDDYPQSDPVGDRGEWDLDNSGNGNLYISPLDGKIHLFGGETGRWRVDQNAFYYQGMGGLHDGYGPVRTPVDPKVFPLISYKDTDNNGYFDAISFDLDGDKKDEFTFSLKELGISDESEVIKINTMKYADFNKLDKSVSEKIWKNALSLVQPAEKQGINTQWYALFKSPKSVRQQYSQGYWLKFYLFKDMLEKAKKENNKSLESSIIKSYFGHK